MTVRAARKLGLKFHSWRGQSLSGPWVVSRKIDGVCVIVTESGEVVSRANKPLYNIPRLAPGIYECFTGSWESTISAVRTMVAAQISQQDFFSLAPVDDRLYLQTLESPTSGEIEALLTAVIRSGDEGLVLCQGDTYLRAKKQETYDVSVIGIIEGKGKHYGRLGALITPMGNVGTGFSDAQRDELINLVEGEPLTIEVACMGLTPSGKFRHPRFVRIRPDKRVEE